MRRSSFVASLQTAFFRGFFNVWFEMIFMIENKLCFFACIRMMLPWSKFGTWIFKNQYAGLQYFFKILINFNFIQFNDLELLSSMFWFEMFTHKSFIFVNISRFWTLHQNLFHKVAKITLKNKIERWHQWWWNNDKY